MPSLTSLAAAVSGRGSQSKSKGAGPYFYSEKTESAGVSEKVVSNPLPPPPVFRGTPPLKRTASIKSSSSKKVGPFTEAELAKIFHTSLLTTQTPARRDLSGELCQLTQTPAFKMILSSIRQLAQLQGISERQATEQLIQTFRKLESIWRDYVFQEGFERLKRPMQKTRGGVSESK